MFIKHWFQRPSENPWMSLRVEGFNLLEIICEILYATHHMIHKKESTGKTKQKGETNSCYKPAFAYNLYFNIYIT